MTEKEPGCVRTGEMQNRLKLSPGQAMCIHGQALTNHFLITSKHGWVMEQLVCQTFSFAVSEARTLE